MASKGAFDVINAAQAMSYPYMSVQKAPDITRWLS